MTVLVNRQDLTGADRQWAAQYQPGDVVRYTRGSRQIGVEAGEYTTETVVDQSRNLLTVRRQDDQDSPTILGGCRV